MGNRLYFTILVNEVCDAADIYTSDVQDWTKFAESLLKPLKKSRS